LRPLLLKVVSHSIRRQLDLELRPLVFRSRRIILGILIELDAEVEAKILELVGGESRRMLLEGQSGRMNRWELYS
jgi:hypothetical protein